jgi:nucleoside-diphosphate-sugar epimerase
MGPIAIIGAGGFVGTRLVESLVLSGQTGVRAVVRAYRNFASLSRFGPAVALEVADAEDSSALARSLRGTDTVVNVTTGAPAGIVRTTRSILGACAAAGVRRLIHLSSAVVFGEVASPRIHDDSPPDTRHWMPYARAKAVSEVWLRAQMPTAPCEIAVLRPGIVWGVRSPHTLGFVKSLLEKSAYLVDGGKGILNSIYIDNLVACIRACHSDTGNVSGFYNVSDRETLTWRDFFGFFAPFLGCDVEQLHNVSANRFPWSMGAVIDYVRSLPLMSDLSHRAKAWLPEGVKMRLKTLLAGHYNYEGTATRRPRKPSVERELWSLQRVRFKLPVHKFERRFGLVPPVSFEDGARRTLSWLTAMGHVPSRPALFIHGAVA